MIITLITPIIILASLAASIFISGNFGSYEVIHKPSPSEVKALYITAYTAGNKNRREDLVKVIEDTELNAIVIDIKDASGRVFFNTDVPLVDKIGAEQIRIPDLKEFLIELRKKGIYTIARIVVFQDPYLAESMPEIALKSTSGNIWRDYKGQAWVDPTNKLIWDYNLDIVKEAIDLGFDEINFDYIRFPSDGNIRTIVYANLDNNSSYEDKNRVMKEFYEYVNQRMQFEKIITSADLFGMTLWRSDGMNIGQRLEDAAPNFDFIAPMVYPSHYPSGFEGFANPAENPYEIIYRSLVAGQPKIEGQRAKLRPWLQDFDLGAVYTPEMIVAQKKATYDGGGQGWMLWNASNNYTIGGLEAE